MYANSTPLTRTQKRGDQEQGDDTGPSRHADDDASALRAGRVGLSHRYVTAQYNRWSS